MDEMISVKQLLPDDDTLVWAWGLKMEMTWTGSLSIRWTAIEPEPQLVRYEVQPGTDQGQWSLIEYPIGNEHEVLRGVTHWAPVKPPEVPNVLTVKRIVGRKLVEERIVRG